MPTKFILSITISLLLFTGVCKASDADTSKVVPMKLDSVLPLPPLDTLIKWALLYSPTLKEQDALIDKNNADSKRIKKILLDAVKLNTGVQFGNYGDPTANKLSTGYNTGASVQFSLYQLFGYKNQMAVYAAEKHVSEFKKDELELELKKLVTIFYNNILAQKSIVKIRSESNYAAYSHVKMAEKEFNEGSVEVGELSRVTEIYTKALVDYEVAINDLKNNYMELEIIVGVKFSELTISK